MLCDKQVMIVEDDVRLALDLSNAVESLDGIVVGPVGTMEEAFAIVRSQSIAAAVLGFELPDGGTIPLARALIKKRVPSSFKQTPTSRHRCRCFDQAFRC